MPHQGWFWDALINSSVDKGSTLSKVYLIPLIIISSALILDLKNTDVKKLRIKIKTTDFKKVLINFMNIY